MKQIIKIGVMCAFVMSIAIANATMLKNSYLVRPAKDHASFMKQIRTEPIVMDRYMRHYSMTREEVITMMEGLKLSRMEKTGVYGIFGVPQNGKIHVNPQVVKKGSKIWVDASGTPILLEICGNPFGLGPKTSTMGDVLAAKPMGQESSDVVAMSSMPVTPVIASVDTPIVVPATPTMPMEEEVVPSARRRNDIGWLALIPIGAAISTTNTNTRPEPVPEPATMLVLAAGSALIARKRKKA